MLCSPYLVVTRALGVTLQQPMLGVWGEEGPHLVPGHQRVPRLGEQRVQVQLCAGVGARHQAPLVICQDLDMKIEYNSMYFISIIKDIGEMK